MSLERTISMSPRKKMSLKDALHGPRSIGTIRLLSIFGANCQDVGQRFGRRTKKNMSPNRAIIIQPNNNHSLLSERWNDPPTVPANINNKPANVDNTPMIRAIIMAGSSNARTINDNKISVLRPRKTADHKPKPKTRALNTQTTIVAIDNSIFSADFTLDYLGIKSASIFLDF